MGRINYLLHPYQQRFLKHWGHLHLPNQPCIVRSLTQSRTLPSFLSTFLFHPTSASYTLTSFHSCELSLNLAPYGNNSVHLSHQPTPPKLSVIQQWLIPSVSSQLFTPISLEIHLKWLSSSLQLLYPQLVRLDGCEVQGQDKDKYAAKKQRE